MIASHRMRIRLSDQGPDGGLEIDAAALVHELVHHEHLGPETPIWCDGCWIPLRDYPQPIWLDEMARQAEHAARRSGAAGVEHQAQKVLRFAAGGDGNEVVRIAKFLLAHLRLCAGLYREAVELLESSIRGPSCVLAASHNNLGVAWAHLRNPLAALKHLELASAEDPDLLVADLSRRNLAAALAAERAVPLPGRPKWAQLLREANDRLRSVPAEQILALVEPDRPFPSYHVLHVFLPGTHFPPLSSQLSRTNQEESAARWLLEEAHQALSDRRYELAAQLARASGERSPALHDPANAVVAMAEARLGETQALRQAAAYAEDLKKFLAALDEMSPKTLDAPREPLVRLAAHAGNKEVWERLYRSRVEQLLVEQSAACTDERRQTRMLELAAAFAEPAKAAIYRQSAKLRRAARSLRQFRQAILAGNDRAADAAYHRLATVLDAAPAESAEVLDGLRQHRANEAFEEEEHAKCRRSAD